MYNLGYVRFREQKRDTQSHLLLLGIPDCGHHPGIPLLGVGWRIVNQPRLTEALNCFGEAVHFQKKALAGTQKNPDFEEGLRDSLYFLAEVKKSLEEGEKKRSPLP